MKSALYKEGLLHSYVTRSCPREQHGTLLPMSKTPCQWYGGWPLAMAFQTPPIHVAQVSSWPCLKTPNIAYLHQCTDTTPGMTHTHTHTHTRTNRHYWIEPLANRINVQEWEDEFGPRQHANASPSIPLEIATNRQCQAGGHTTVNTRWFKTHDVFH